MRSFKLFAISLITVTGLVMLNSCEADDTNSTGPGTGESTLTISHWGVDWSKGHAGSEGNEVPYDSGDGYTVSWCPVGDRVDGVFGLWYSPYMYPVKVMKLEATELSEVTSIDTTQWATTVCSIPLQNGEVWAAEARDGFVVFKVVSTLTDSAAIAQSHDWPVSVEYKYSATTEF